MPIKDLLVHVDQSPATAIRLDAALELGECFGAHVTALHLIAEPFMRTMAGYHLPADILKEHLRQAEAEAEQVSAQAREAAQHRGISLETRVESGSLDRLPALLARNARNADLVIVGEPNADAGGADETLLVEAAFMDTGRPALVTIAHLRSGMIATLSRAKWKRLDTRRLRAALACGPTRTAWNCSCSSRPRAW